MLINVNEKKHEKTAENLTHHHYIESNELTKLTFKLTSN